MSKSHIKAFAKGQMNALLAKDNKDRLKYTIAGCRNGHLYAHDGSDFGLYDADATDTEWITLKDLELQRITGVKLAKINEMAIAFFAIDNEELPWAEPKEEQNSQVVEVEPKEDKIDFDAVEKACKKAIKKEDIKKATKLLAKLEGQDCHKKLSKKLGKLA